MRLAFCLPKYFPFGGLQANFMRIACFCRERGHDIAIYTLAWEGDIPDEFAVHVIAVRALRNHTKNAEFIAKVQPLLRQGRYDVVIGFLKMPGLDIYYAADPCFQAKVQHNRHWLYRFGARYRYFSACERAVFRADGHTQILILSEAEMMNYIDVYHTPSRRFYLLPPGISPHYKARADAGVMRSEFRREFAVGERDKLLLMIGSGFKTKGVDRTLRALAALPRAVRSKTLLMIVGEGRAGPFQWLARRLGIADSVRFMAGRSDIDRFLFAADLLVHPAYTENTGNVILEAIIAGLPVLTTANCGYAFHVERAQAGKVVAVPFEQSNLNACLAEMLTGAHLKEYSQNGIQYGKTEDLYSRPAIAADIILNSIKGTRCARSDER